MLLYLFSPVQGEAKFAAEWFKQQTPSLLSIFYPPALTFQFNKCFGLDPRKVTLHAAASNMPGQFVVLLLMFLLSPYGRDPNTNLQITPDIFYLVFLFLCALSLHSGVKWMIVSCIS